MSAMNLKGRVAVVTGAGSGIGRATSMALARRGCHLALADINATGLAQTARDAKAHGVRVTCHDLDVASRDKVRMLPAEVNAGHGRVDILVNNAGVALGGNFEQVCESDFDWLMEINFHGVVRMTRAFLPYLHAGDDSRIVNVSSLYGLISPAGQAAYSASKFAVRGFSNALRHELDGSCVGVTVVHPGGVATSIAKNARVPAGVPDEEVQRRKALADKLLRMPPEKAGEIIVRGIERRKARVLVGADAKIASLLERIAPVGYWSLLKKRIPE
ncbi:SDR family NAD(P)-dependent oxidoreductase [Noviherbaspirillum sp.]|uniref:SDR family NAD(P)-dependent oxidoreductase n=1 Tax=Noviherbaspirillum sp. TaxID=1926288 RepID=UPI002D506630|nr:SDR family NAD(P)-dependent oxidoreductase [Noviherbaspirillum sp.]HZW21297.1 SDR family NAD(P)-dependent oxidoreductase [Noviherbaspirillum sp.]